MTIKELEQLSEMTRANIRFYEKEGLLSPARNESGYRDYSEADIQLLKKIIILRKLGIPVQQIGDILDGALPLQEALEENYSTTAEMNSAIEQSAERVKTTVSETYSRSLRPKATRMRLKRTRTTARTRS